MPTISMAQSETYDMAFVPDLWYNKVDGLRLGMRFSGEMEGSFKDGPHRLDAGFWVGSKWPEHPVSYYISFTEPITALSKFGSEANVQLQSSIRTGYSQHSLSLNKRFQKGFDELRYQELSVKLSQEKAIGNEYRLIPFEETEWKTLAGIDFSTSGYTPIGALKTNITLKQNVSGSSDNFSLGKAELKHLTELGKGYALNLRLFGAIVSTDAPWEYKFSSANREAISWLSNGVTRASGTIPDSFFENGIVQLAGGFNLRGYNVEYYSSDITSNDHTQSYFGTIDKGVSINTEFVFPNFINSLFKQTIMGDFIHLKSYIFHDIGKLSGSVIQDNITIEVDKITADAGVGFQFSINIPDWLGKDRGFAIRYDMPFWLSDPDGLQPKAPSGSGSSEFKFRGILGIGASISL